MKYLEDADVTLYNGDCLEVLRTLPDRSVHMCATSPPFYGLRDYGTGTWEGGDKGCDHVASPTGGPQPLNRPDSGGGEGMNFRRGNDGQFREVCGKCGARRIDRQIGLEESPDEWVARLVEVFREVRRVLRDDGTLWVEIGDSYATKPNNNAYHGKGPDTSGLTNPGYQSAVRTPGVFGPPEGTKPKDLLGQPWLLAFALRADGWYLRSEIIWARPNPMPESVTDRPTKAHSTVFLLSKSPRYFYDQEAIREANAPGYDGLPDNRRQSSAETLKRRDERENTVGDHLRARGSGGNTGIRDSGARAYNGMGANARSVWTIPTEPTPFAHFATWPQKLVSRMILAGTSERGVCPECGGPWVRETQDQGYTKHRPSAGNDPRSRSEDKQAEGSLGGHHGWQGNNLLKNTPLTVGWLPSCKCSPTPDEQAGVTALTPATVLDPFGGSGTTALVARKLGRKAILIELNEEYCELASSRLAQQSLFAVADD